MTHQNPPSTNSLTLFSILAVLPFLALGLGWSLWPSGSLHLESADAGLPATIKVTGDQARLTWRGQTLELVVAPHDWQGPLTFSPRSAHDAQKLPPVVSVGFTLVRQQAGWWTCKTCAHDGALPTPWRSVEQ